MLRVGANGKNFLAKLQKAVVFKVGAKHGLQIPHVGQETKATNGNSGERLVRFQ